MSRFLIVIASSLFLVASHSHAFSYWQQDTAILTTRVHWSGAQEAKWIVFNAPDHYPKLLTTLGINVTDHLPSGCALPDNTNIASVLTSLTTPKLLGVVGSGFALEGMLAVAADTATDGGAGAPMVIYTFKRSTPVQEE